MVEGNNGAPPATWDAILAEMERLAANRERSCSEDFAFHRARKLQEDLRSESPPQAHEAPKPIVAMRAKLAMERKKHRVLQDRIDNARSQAKAAEATRAKLQVELAEVSRQVAQNPTDSPRKQAATERTRDLEAQIVATKVEAKQVAEETRGMAVERHQIEALIAEAEARRTGGYFGAEGQDPVKTELLQIAHRASDNARTLQEAMAEVSSKVQQATAIRDTGAAPEASAMAAFLNSSHGRSVGQSKTDISRGHFHASGGLQYLANHGQGSTVMSPHSATAPNPAQGPSFESIEERLLALRGHLSDMASQRQYVNGSAKHPS